ncbi:MAG: hypothetical protein PQJ61_06080 [Spirochaetales bacterium]|uniref:Uncharacterized protein n=1 Tax=Candidatus Thalassospirochaeta sargassi TaxID=3119039 RepID=A0AAJ1IEG0_9SPIO|nr:hypothetical protein [Spirochaetales bacterium]
MQVPILIYIVFIAFVFYAFLPLVGAFSVRQKWRVFRSRVAEAGLSKEVSYSDPPRNSSGQAGMYCFTGELQAIQDDSSIWLNNGRVSVRAEMKGLKLYLLPSNRSIDNEGRNEQNKALLPQDMPKRLSWERVYSLTQGTGVLLSGEVFIENGTPVFRNTEDSPLLVIIYDGKKETILRRSIWSGRQLNEYWNNFTPLSLIAGSFFLFVITFFLLRGSVPDNVSILSGLMIFLPLMPFLPPGIFFYFFFRRLWRSGRYLRGERDLLRLVLSYPDYIEFESCDDAIAEYPDAKLRSCGIIDETKVLSMPCRVYVSADLEAERRSSHFYEDLIVPGDPEDLASKCRSRARIMEILAAASIAVGFIINVVLFYLILLWLI